MAGPVAFSGSGRSLAVMDAGKGITIWDVGTRRPTTSLPLEPETSAIAMRFIEGDRMLQATLVTPQNDAGPFIWRYATALWDVTSGERRGGRESGLHPCTLIVSTDGRCGVVSSPRSEPALVDFESGRRLAEIGGLNDNAIFTADGEALVACERGEGVRGSISIRDVPSGRLRRRWVIDERFIALQGQLSLSADAGRLAVGGYPDVNSAAVIDLVSGKVLGSVVCGRELSVCDAVELSPDGRILMTCTGSIDFKDQPTLPLLKLWRLPDSW